MLSMIRKLTGCSNGALLLFNLVGTLLAWSEVRSSMEHPVEVLLAALAQRLKDDAALVEPLAARGRDLARVAGPGHHRVWNVVQRGEGTA